VLLLSISEKKALMQEAADKEEVQCQKKHFSYLQLSEISSVWQVRIFFVSQTFTLFAD